MYIPEMEQKVEKKILVFQINPFELRVTNSQNLEWDTSASPDNVLTNTTKISPNSRGTIFGINFLENDEKP